MWKWVGRREAITAGRVVHIASKQKTRTKAAPDSGVFLLHLSLPLIPQM